MKSVGMNLVSNISINQLTNNQALNKTPNVQQGNLAGIAAKKAESPMESPNQMAGSSAAQQTQGMGNAMKELTKVLGDLIKMLKQMIQELQKNSQSGQGKQAEKGATKGQEGVDGAGLDGQMDMLSKIMEMLGKILELLKQMLGQMQGANQGNANQAVAPEQDVAEVANA
jgi:uncharacterized spore protein YtfJ